MGDIVYVVQKRIKNSIVEFIHTLAKLIMLIINRAVIVGLIILNTFIRAGDDDESSSADIGYFKGTCFAWEAIFALVCFVLSAGIRDNCDMPVVKNWNDKKSLPRSSGVLKISP